MRSQKSGFALVEALVAGAILIIIALAVGYFVSGQKNAAIRVEGSGLCQNVVTSILTDFKSRDNKLQIWNYISAAMPGSSSKLPRTVMDWVATPAPGLAYNFQNIDSSTTDFYHFYRAQNQICTSGVDLKANSIVIQDNSTRAAVSGATDFDFTIKVEPVNMQNGNFTGACSDIENIRPGNNRGVSGNLGLQVSVVATALKANQAGCQGSVLLAYEGDTISPTLSTVVVEGYRGATVVNPFQPISASSPIPTLNYTNTLCDVTSVRVTVGSNEPGSIFLCAHSNGATFGDANDYVPCGNFDLNGTRALVTELTPPTAFNQGTQAYLIFPSPANGRYAFYTKVMDTAGNISGTGQLVAFTVDLTRPTWVSALTPAAVPNPAVVNTIQNAPAGQDPQAVPAYGTFGDTTNYYQCRTTLQPSFEGDLDASSWLWNENCTGTTSDGRIASGVVTQSSPVNQCRWLFKVEGLPGISFWMLKWWTLV